MSKHICKLQCNDCNGNIKAAGHVGAHPSMFLDELFQLVWQTWKKGPEEQLC